MNALRRRFKTFFFVCIALLPAFSGAQEQAAARVEAASPKVALVLSGGAALGFAHVGFLKVLEEIGIPVDLVVGNSMGSLIGSLYAAGYSPGDIEAVAGEINWARIFLNEGVDSSEGLLGERTALLNLAFDKTGRGSSRGLLPDQNITLLLSRLTYRVSMTEDFESLPTPFQAFATDIAGGGGVPLDRGPLYRAVRSSISIPVVFPPVPHEGTFLVDGGLLDNNPVDLALEWGADIIINIDVGSFVTRSSAELNGVETITDQTIRLIQSRGGGPENTQFRINMDLSDFFWTDFAKAKQLIDRGEAIAREAENMDNLLKLAAEVAQTRSLEKRDWRRQGTYAALDDPVFSTARLDSLAVDGAAEDRKTVDEEFSRKYLDSLFGVFYGSQDVDLIRLEGAVEMLRRKGNYENVGYHVIKTEDTYTLVLTALRSRERKNEFSLALSGHAVGGTKARLGGESHLELRMTDAFLPGSLLALRFSANFSDVQGALFKAAYTQKLSSHFSARMEGEGEYYRATINAQNIAGELSTFSSAFALSALSWNPSDFFSLSLAYRLSILDFEDKTPLLGGQRESSYIGSLHTALLDLSFNTMSMTSPLFWNLLANMDVQAIVEFPFAGSSLYAANTFPWYERLEVLALKAWLPRQSSSFTAEAVFASYLGELESRWTLFSPVGKNNIPGFCASDSLSRNKLVLGLTCLEEIVPLSNALNTRTFFALTVRGGTFWTPLENARRFNDSWLAGVRAGLQFQTPVGTLFFGPELSSDRSFLFCVYFN